MKPARHTGKQKLTLAVLAGLVVVSVFILPRMVQEPWLLDESAESSVPPVASSSEVAPSTVAEKTRYRQESQTVLAEIIAVRDRLIERQVESWAPVEFSQAQAQVTGGDAQYQYGEYAESLASYRKALEVMNSLEQLGQSKLERAVVDGQSAIEALNANTAQTAIELASLIAPDDPRVVSLQERLAALPEVAALVEAGDQAQALDELAEARDAFQRAVSLDPAHQRAAQSLAAVLDELTSADFRQYMSRGYAALEGGNFSAAREAFRAANWVRPNDPAIAQALAQVDNRESQTGVSERLSQAAGLEAAESWAEAVGLYEGLLAEDPSLDQARVRLIPAQVRAALDADLSAYIEDPLKLSNGAVHRQAQARLADARGITNPGPRLTGQIDTVERLLVAAMSSVAVEFQSDNQTEVTLFRVAQLGRFERHHMKLKPGRYIAAGTRKGFRDVRVEFTITGAEEVGPIVVRCEEPI